VQAVGICGPHDFIGAFLDKRENWIQQALKAGGNLSVDTAHEANCAWKPELLHDQSRFQSHDSCMVESNFWSWKVAERFKG
jgi:hypothetical protein